MIRQLMLALALAASAFAAPRYLLVFHNLNSFTDPADQDMAVEAYKGFEAMARRNGVTVQPYFTGLSFEMYLRKAPELMEELRRSGRDWNHQRQPPAAAYPHGSGARQAGEVLGPTALEEEGAAPVRVTASQVRTAARGLAPAKALPSRVEVGGQTVNAARFLYLMAKIVGGAAEAEAPPMGMLPPVEPRDPRSRDTLSRLQIWTYKPAYYDKLGGRPQRPVSAGT